MNNPALENFARVVFIHQIEEGKPLDVTKDHVRIDSLIQWAEKEALIEIDVAGYKYKLTDKGLRLYQAQLDEAQDIIRRYDIFGDVDVDSSGKARFDTGLGADLRVPIWEMDGVDPFRARLLLGLNDEEWKNIDWEETVLEEGWYDEVFAPIEGAPAVEAVGVERLKQIIEQGKTALRTDPAFSAFPVNPSNSDSWR